MQLQAPPHVLPYEDVHFQSVLEQARLSARDVMADGTTYPEFVDRLFKQMPMMSPQAAYDIVAKATSTEGLDAEQFIAGLQEAMRNPDGSAMHAAVGVAGEGGELLDCVKKVFIYGKSWTAVDAKTGMTPLENVLEELADDRFYQRKLMNMMGITDADVEAYSMHKLRKRYASGRYSDAQAVARADKDRPAIADQQPARQFLGQTK